MAAGFYTGGGVTVIMDPAPLIYVNVFHKESPPDRHLGRQARQVANLASVIAPKDTGRLAASIRVDQNRNEHGQFAFGYKVYTNVFYAFYVHEGTGPSIRENPRPEKPIRFRGTNTHLGKTVFTRQVNHPGTPANEFLQNALIALVL